MGMSSSLKKKIESLSFSDIERMIRMGWEDRVTFEGVESEFEFSENEFVKFMRSQLKPADFSRWRKRVRSKGHLKHQIKKEFQKEWE